jgi:hypothetical protein
MEIVQQQHIRVKPLRPFQKPLRSPAASEAMPVRSTGQQTVGPYLHRCIDPIVTAGSSSVSNFYGVALLLQRLFLPDADPPHRSGSAYRIDDQNAHRIRPHFSYSVCRILPGILGEQPEIPFLPGKHYAPPKTGKFCNTPL